jgi:hypothetical protein
MNLRGASRVVIGFWPPANAVLQSWQTEDGTLLLDIWELLRETLPDPIAEPETDKEPAPRLKEGEDTTSHPPVEETRDGELWSKDDEPFVPIPVFESVPPFRELIDAAPKHGDIDTSAKDLEVRAVTSGAIEIRAFGEDTEIVIRASTGEQIAMLLQPADAGALGAQLSSASFRPLQSSYVLADLSPSEGVLTDGRLFDIAAPEMAAEERESFTASIGALLDARLINAGDRFTWSRPVIGDSYTVAVTERGTLELEDGREVRSASSAVSELAGSTAQGLDVWKRDRDGLSLRQLSSQLHAAVSIA